MKGKLKRMLNVLFAYKTLSDLIKDEVGEFGGVATDTNVVKGLAENMLFITQDFSDGDTVCGFGLELLSDYFGRVPEPMRADVYVEYFKLLKENGFDVDYIKNQAAA